MLTVSELEPGTSEAEWLAWTSLQEAPSLVLPPAGRLVVVAPHPDDEVLGAAGLMRQAVAQGLTVEVVAVTDGEASHPGLRRHPSTLRARRRHETLAALGELDLDVAIHRLTLPDGGVAGREALLLARLTTILDPGALCVSPWRRDGHPDHDATGRASAAACHRTGAVLVEFPVWAWHWATPTSGLPAAALRRLGLSRADQAAKAAAIARFGSQIRPHPDAPDDPVVLPPAVLERFRRRFETFIVGGAR